MNETQVVAVFGTFVIGALLLALLVLYLDRRDRRDEAHDVRAHHRPAE